MSELIDFHPVAALDESGRLLWVQTLGGMSAALLGLEGVVIAVLYAVSPGPRFARALKAAGEGFTRLSLTSLAMLAGCTAGFALVVPFVATPERRAPMLVLLALIVMSMLRTARLLILFGMVLRVFALDATEATDNPPGSTAEVAAPAKWAPPVVEPRALDVAPRRGRRK